MQIKKNIPNMITAVRIICTAALLFIKPMTLNFYWVYTLSGLSDVLDGFVARLTGTSSLFGAKLDSIADLLFYAVMLIRIFPILWDKLPVQIWYGVGTVIFIRLLAYVIAAVKFHCFASMHTYLNKATGLMVFLVPYIIQWRYALPLCFFVVAVAAISSTEELAIHFIRKTYNPNLKSILNCK